MLSIKPVKRGPGMQVGITDPTPNGFTATAFMQQLLAFAYGPPVPANQSGVWGITEMRANLGGSMKTFTPLMRECHTPI